MFADTDAELLPENSAGPAAAAGPQWIEIDGEPAPAAPRSLVDCGLTPDHLADLALRAAYTVPHFVNEWTSEQLQLPAPLINELLERLMHDKFIEILGQAGPLSYRWAITNLGRERAGRLMEISGYVGPVPVALSDYTERLSWQFNRLPHVTPREAADALADLVLPHEALEVAGLAISSRRSLFLYGPPGNGKTSVGHMLHNALKGHIWVPHALTVDNSVIRLYDRQVHRAAPLDLRPDQRRLVDRRWVRIERPFVVVAGDLSIHDLDISYSQSLNYYEAPLHVKANGGIFLLDDFGCQRAEPRQILNRWVFPLENGIDYLTLQTGQKLCVPFRQMLIVSTNLKPDHVMDPAFLRRMGYRLYIGDPDAQRYAEIFKRYMASVGVAVPPGLIEQLVTRYRLQNRPLRGCEPRDLIERARDICVFRGEPFRLDAEIMDLAWKGYFGQT